MIIRSNKITINPNSTYIETLTFDPKIKKKLIKISLAIANEAFYDRINVKIYIDGKILDWDLKGIDFWATRGIFDVLFLGKINFYKEIKLEIKNNDTIFSYILSYYILIE